MEIYRSIDEMKKRSNELRAEAKSIGLVPTMGFFHDGHLKLMKEAMDKDNFVVVSIFVNPLQFGPNEDFDEYPRNEERDLKLAEKMGVHAVFIPTTQEMYPVEPSIAMKVTKRTNVLCGSKRPGHFDGVVTVLTKLFNIIQPTRAYFGKKDAQQLAVVDSLVNDFNFPLQLIGVPTAREHNGLAKSSRNVFLSDTEKKEAVWIFKALHAGKQLALSGENNTDTIINEVTKMVVSHTSGVVEYVELLSYPELQKIRWMDETVILAMAVQFKRARLIDNLIFNLDEYNHT